MPPRVRRLAFPRATVAPGAASALRTPRSATGKASGKRKARMATYWAVHSPMPRMRRSAVMASSKVAVGPKFRSPSLRRFGQFLQGERPRLRQPDGGNFPGRGRRHNRELTEEAGSDAQKGL